MPVYLAHMPAGSSLKDIMHWSQVGEGELEVVEKEMELKGKEIIGWGEMRGAKWMKGMRKR